MRAEGELEQRETLVDRVRKRRQYYSLTQRRLGVEEDKDMDGRR